MFYGRDSNAELYPLYAPDFEDTDTSADDEGLKCDVRLTSHHCSYSLQLNV